jgi:hypothetical protein
VARAPLGVPVLVARSELLAEAQLGTPSVRQCARTIDMKSARSSGKMIRHGVIRIGRAIRVKAKLAIDGLKETSIAARRANRASLGDFRSSE